MSIGKYTFNIRYMGRSRKKRPRTKNSNQSSTFKHQNKFILKNQPKQQSEENEWRESLKKFQDQLAAFNLKIKLSKADGNCLFRSISDQLEGTENNHSFYRSQIVILC